MLITLLAMPRARQDPMEKLREATGASREAPS
jgi:hypothetical protein